MRAVVVLVLVGACRFSPGAAPGGIDAPAPAPDVEPEPDVAVARPFCDPAEATLVACYEFEGTTTDGSVHHLDPATATSIRYTAGVMGQAIDVEPATEIDVVETPLLGLSAVTIERRYATAARRQQHWAHARRQQPARRR